jgi:hypothetical protein
VCVLCVQVVYVDKPVEVEKLVYVDKPHIIEKVRVRHCLCSSQLLSVPPCGPEHARDQVVTVPVDKIVERVVEVPVEKVVYQHVEVSALVWRLVSAPFCPFLPLFCPARCQLNCSTDCVSYNGPH